MSQPVKRGPGRPRKQPAPDPVQEAPSEAAAEAEAPEADVPVDPSDPRIGQKCHPSWSGIGYDDGTSYRCENGKIVERVI